MADRLAGQPILIVREGTQRTPKRDAQRMNITVGWTIAEATKSVLGPRGLDKMLVDSLGDVSISNDGFFILDKLQMDHPAGKMMVQIAKALDQEVGDGTTSAVLVAGTLLKMAEGLLEEKIHPTTIISGYTKAVAKAQEILDRMAIDIDPDDKEILKKIAITSMNSKSIAGSKEFFADLAVDAIKQIQEIRGDKIIADIDMVNLFKQKGKVLDETELIKGMVVDKELAYEGMPRRVKDAKIALIAMPMVIEKTKFDSTVSITDPTSMKAFRDEETQMFKDMVDQIASTGANVVLSQKGCEDIARYYLSKAGIMTVIRIKETDMERLAKATEGKIVKNIFDLSADQLGYAGLVEEVKIGEDKMTFIRECKNPRAVTIVIYGSSEQTVDEAERSLQDALCVVRNAVQEPKIVAGGGSIEVEIAKNLRDYAQSIGGREQLAIEAFAEAFETIPKTLAENAGHDPLDVIVDLRSKHEDPDKKWYGVNVFTGESADMLEEGVVEPLIVKKQIIKSASEAAKMILRIDEVIASKKREPRAPPGGYDMMPPMY